MNELCFFFNIRRDAEINELNNTVEDNQALIASLQRKIKELEVSWLIYTHHYLLTIREK